MMTWLGLYFFMDLNEPSLVEKLVMCCRIPFYSRSFIVAQQD